MAEHGSRRERTPGHVASRLGRAPGRLVAAMLGMVASLALAACAGGSSDIPGSSPSPPRGTVINVFAFAVAKPAYDEVIPGFEASPQGTDITVLTSFGASGDQARKIIAGAPADVVHGSINPDVTNVEDAGLVDEDWDSGPAAGAPMGSVVVFVVREGNPQGIHDWDDLLRPGIDVVTPNPLSSGSAQWNLMAPYAVHSQGGKDPQAGLDYIETLVNEHVTVQPSSGAEASESFRQGQGDVLLSYEYEAQTSIAKGDDWEYVVPDETLRIDNPIAVVNSSPHEEEAQAFVDYMHSAEAQRAMAEVGFRPRHPDVVAEYAAEFPEPDVLWTVPDLGGWPTVTRELFDKESGAITDIYRNATG